MHLIMIVQIKMNGKLYRMKQFEIVFVDIIIRLS